MSEKDAKPQATQAPRATHDMQAKALAEDFVRGALLMRDAIRKIRESIARDQKSGPRDATSFAGELAGALLRAGAQLPMDRNPNALRWHVDEGINTLAADPDGSHSAALLGNLVFACLRRGKGKDVLLERVADVWPKHRTKALADAAMDLIARDEGERLRQQHQAEHEKRLGEIAQKAKAAQQPKLPRAVDPLQRGQRSEQPDGEFLVGNPDDFSGRPPSRVG